METNEALASKSMASLDSRSKPSPPSGATKDLASTILATQEADTWAPETVGYYCYFAE